MAWSRSPSQLRAGRDLYLSISGEALVQRLTPVRSASPRMQEREAEMLFLVIERYRDNDMVPAYQRLRDQGRVLPEGLEYVDSWIEPSFSRCFQLMRCDDLRRLQEWVMQWRGTGATFEIVPVVPSKETREVVSPYLDARQD